jgi:hypothetical protein
MHTFHPNFVLGLIMVILARTGSTTAQPARPDEAVTIFRNVTVEFDSSIAEGTRRDGVVLKQNGQLIETTVDLPPLPGDQRDARRIVATLTVKPAMVGSGERARPGDAWTRAGSVLIGKPTSKPPSATSAPAASEPASIDPDAVEAMRFITNFGGEAVYTQDLTPLAPLLSGKTTIAISLSSFKKPGWIVSLTIEFTRSGVGYRRPVFAQPLFRSEQVTSAENLLRARILVPAGLDRPRIRIITSGHASDGTGGDEFITRTHVLTIDGKEVARWRPWLEEGGTLRAANPWSGRTRLGGRERWSSDLDRSGWRPGQIVEPLYLPAPELTPGEHTIELRIEGIRPKDQTGYGYWRISAIAVADEPWPGEDAPAGPNPATAPVPNAP